jgi:hypothetical protein
MPLLNDGIDRYLCMNGRQAMRDECVAAHVAGWAVPPGGREFFVYAGKLKSMMDVTRSDAAGPNCSELHISHPPSGVPIASTTQVEFQ